MHYHHLEVHLYLAGGKKGGNPQFWQHEVGQKEEFIMTTSFKFEDSKATLNFQVESKKIQLRKIAGNFEMKLVKRKT